MNIILCGLPMSGKSTIGKLIAEKLNRTFIDTDRLIEKTYNMAKDKTYTCRQIYFLEGETVFRRLESHQIAALKNAKTSIIAVGGGSLINPENVRIIQGIGSLIYLKVSPDILWKRLSAKSLPTYLDRENPEKDFFNLAEKRCPTFEEEARFIIETDGLSEEQTAEAVIKLMEKSNGK